MTFLEKNKGEIADILSRPADAYNFECFALDASNQRFDEFSSDIQTDNMLIGWFAIGGERLFDFVE